MWMPKKKNAIQVSESRDGEKRKFVHLFYFANNIQKTHNSINKISDGSLTILSLNIQGE